MLKSYPKEDLRPGMVLGRDILGADGKAIYKKGTKLVYEMITDIKTKPVVSVYVEEVPMGPEINIPGKEHLLDDAYVKVYESIYLRVQELFNKLLETEELDIAELNAIVDEEICAKLLSGAKAVSQIHNMDRDGSVIIHHNLHVAILAGLMGKWLRYDSGRQHDLVVAGLLHDVGKLKVPKEVLEKQGKLTDEEFAMIKRHPEYSYGLLKLGPLRDKQDILFGILQHHERCDGSGYPDRLKKDRINYFACIIAILDIYDAMATNRSYAKRNSPFDVFSTLYEDILKGKLDTEYGVPFLRHLCHSLNGNWVCLDNGEKGRIVYIDESRVTAMPIVQTTHGKFIDLNHDTSVKIESLLTARELE